MSADKLKKLQRGAVGLDAKYALADGRVTRRIYLDNAATTLPLGAVKDALAAYLPHYASSHSEAHFAAKLATKMLEDAHQTLLQFVGADETYAGFFVGSGATGGLNRIARMFAQLRPERDVVIASTMEHHSNDLPHRKHAQKVVHAQVADGAIDVARVQAALREHAGRVNYVAISGVSNVTGVINPVHEIAEIAHAHDAWIVVDAAQMAAHLPMQVCRDNPAENLDAVCLSGHKLYAPMAPGAAVVRRDLLLAVEPDELGGGMVDDVFLHQYLPTEKLPAREHAGTPNIIGAVLLATAMRALQSVGMQTICAHESELMRYALQQLGQLDDVVIYADADMERTPRTGALSFNLRDMHHSLTAAILNDYFNIAVRNACFCAHPYVRDMIGDELSEHLDFGNMSNAELEAVADMHRGMVRASFALYNQKRDVDALADALKKIIADKSAYAKHYRQNDAGDYVHADFVFDRDAMFSIDRLVERWFAK